MIVGVSGASSEIAKHFIDAYCGGFEVITARNPVDLPVGCDNFFICSGVLHGETIGDISEEDAAETMFVNFHNIARFCDLVFRGNTQARVCVVGSASGEQGSYDMTYAGAKSALHMYVRKKKLQTAQQHLVCVAPWIIEDAKMTTDRDDYKVIMRRGKERRLRRWLRAHEVSRVANFALNENALCNEVLQLKGGNW